MSYIEDINILQSVTFDDMVNTAAQNLSSDKRVSPWLGLSHGVKLLETEDELNKYLCAYGEMHKEKINLALESITDPTEFVNKDITIIDWGCGQGLATVCFFDYMHGLGLLPNVKKVILIEPSRVAIERAIFHVSKFIDSSAIMAKNEYANDIRVINSNEHTDEDGNPVTSQSAMVIIDHTTGNVVGCVGQIGEKTTNFNLNRVTSLRQTGSSMKPLAVIVPGLEEGLITAASVYDDVPTDFGGGATVKNYYGYYKGLSTIRYVIEISQNVIPAKIITQLTPKKSMEYIEKMGITTIDEVEDNSYSLALGGLTFGVSPLEMAGAYATIANNGVYIEPTFYTKVEDDSGVVLEPNQESHRVMSEGNAYIAQSILTQPVVGTDPLVTARACKVAGMETAAKTGTTDEDKDRWLCGFTPYYTAAIWYGFDQPERLIVGSNPGSEVFSRVMNKIHEELPNKNFDVPDNIVRVAVCKDSGLLPGEHCNATVNGNRVYTEVFVDGTQPKKTCDVHVTAKVCPVDGQEGVYELANDNCPNAVERTFITRPNSDTNTAWHSASDAKFMLPTKVCERHKEAPDKEAPVITLKGNSTVTIKVGSTYKDAGATATDNKDGDLTSKIVTTGKVDTSKAGKYTITYTVEDAAKNKATKTRTVIVESESGSEDEPGDNTNTVEDPDSNTVTPPVTDSEEPEEPVDNEVENTIDTRVININE